MGNIFMNGLKTPDVYHDKRDGLSVAHAPQHEDVSVQERAMESFRILDPETGKIEFHWGNMDTLSPGTLYHYENVYDEMVPCYVFEAEKPFRTTLQVVGKMQSTIVVKDLEPDPAIHLGYVPHYRIHTTDMSQMLMSLTIQRGRMHGEFFFKKRGSSWSLKLNT